MSGSEAPTARWNGPGVLLVLATAILSGVATFVNAYAVHGTTSDVFVTVRNLAVVALLIPLAVLGERHRRGALSRTDWVRLVTIGLVGGAIPFLLFFLGPALATAAGGAAAASFGYRTLFLMATVLGVVVLRERLHGRLVLAAALLLVGNALLLTFTGPIWTDGTLYVLAATGLWAIEYTISKRALRDLPSSTVGIGRMGFGAAFLLGYLALSGQLGGVAALTGGQWEWAAISAVLLTGFVATWYAGLQRVDLGVGASVLVLGVPVTYALSLAFRGGTLAPVAAIGAATVAIGVALAVGLAQWRATWEFLRVALTAGPRPTA
ncbi:MAG: DMT family transporter [Thermoplasmata archaeon]|nr:DMT family transporter [Thermoplasmata archaeon]